MADSIETVLRKYWEFDKFLPLQRKAMECVCRGRDSIAVLPTGGGKSLCFQAPALVLPQLTLVISPLISLMKDQIDSLLDSGVPAGWTAPCLIRKETRHMAGCGASIKASLCIAGTAPDAGIPGFSERQRHFFRCHR
jgi:ATP-dependent DNA helicase RecQ